MHSTPTGLTLAKRNWGRGVGLNSLNGIVPYSVWFKINKYRVHLDTMEPINHNFIISYRIT